MRNIENDSELTLDVNIDLRRAAELITNTFTSLTDMTFFVFIPFFLIYLTIPRARYMTKSTAY